MHLAFLVVRTIRTGRRVRTATCRSLAPGARRCPDGRGAGCPAPDRRGPCGSSCRRSGSQYLRKRCLRATLRGRMRRCSNGPFRGGPERWLQTDEQSEFEERFGVVGRSGRGFGSFRRALRPERGFAGSFATKCSRRNCCSGAHPTHSSRALPLNEPGAQPTSVDGCVEPRIFGEQADAMVVIIVKETVQGGGSVCGQSSACRSSMALW